MDKNILKWSAPAWLQAFREFLSNPSQVEEFGNCRPGHCDAETDLTRWEMCQGGRREFSLLRRLHEAGALGPVSANPELIEHLEALHSILSCESSEYKRSWRQSAVDLCLSRVKKREALRA